MIFVEVILMKSVQEYEDELEFKEKRISCWEQHRYVIRRDDALYYSERAGVRP